MFVIKRSGQKVPIRYDSITDRNIQLARDLDINVDMLSKNVILSLKDCMTTSEIDDLSSETAAYMSTYEPDYDTLAARICVSNHHKSTLSSFYETMKALYEYINPHTKRRSNIISEEFMKFVSDNKEQLDSWINHENDYNYSYFGFKTLQKLYLQKMGKKVIERPQHMLMRVSVAIHFPFVQNNDLSPILETYKELSNGTFTHASPTLFNAGSKFGNLSSCFLLQMDDAMEHIYETNTRCALISKFGGGIGIDITRIRAKGSPIHSTNGTSDGLVPMCQVLNATCRYANQCFHPDTYVLTSHGPKMIKDVTTQDIAVTMDGSFKPIVGKITNLVDKEVLQIETEHSLEDTVVTKDHKIFALKGPFDIRYLQTSGIEPSYIAAEELTTDHYVGFPDWKVESKESTFDDHDIYRFYGIMLGTGRISNTKYSITLRRSVKLDVYIFIKSFLDKRNIEYTMEIKQSEIEIYFEIPNGHEDIPSKDAIYDEQNRKRIRWDFYDCSLPHAIQIYRGLKESTVVYKERSVITGRLLVHTLKYLMLIYKVQIKGQWTNIDDNYTFVIDGSSQILSETFQSGISYKGMTWYKVTSVTQGKYSGPTYDLSILDNNNYIVLNLGVVHNSGKRKGSFAVYLQPWHPDVLDFLALRLNNPPEELRARDLFLAMWIPDIFMRRVEEDKDWSLICPSVVPELLTTHSEEFDKIYLEAEASNKAVKVVKARDVWKAILESQVESGLPYILYKDHVNKKNNQSNIGIINSSNLCVSGDTWILTFLGYAQIKDIVGKETKIWNGFEWSNVIPTKTGSDVQLLTIQFSSNSKVNMTYYHKIPVKNVTAPKGYYFVEAQDIKIGTELYTGNNPDGSKMAPVKVTGISLLEGLHDTFCFTEPLRNFGIFNGVLLGNCTEIMEYTSPDSVAVCNLASIALPKFVNIVDKTFNFKELGRIVKIIVNNINHVIDVNFYPIPEAKKNNLDLRPMGIGVQGLADVFAMLKLSWDQEEAKLLNQQIFETIYYHALEKSCEMAKVEGSYNGFEGSPASQGVLQFHMWNKTPTDMYDWEPLIEKVKKGLRNSLMIAPMPTASTAQILGNNEACEPYTSNVYSRSTLAGDFVVINKHLYKDLKELGMWDKSLVNKIIENNGSISNIEDIPAELKGIYKTVWEISQKVIIDMAADRGAFIDQSQSMNIFIDKPTHAKLSSMHMYGWKKGLKTGSYYIRSKPARDAVKFTILNEEEKKGKEFYKNGKKFVCYDDVCTSCSS